MTTDDRNYREKTGNVIPEVCKVHDCPFNQVEWGKLVQTVSDIKDMVMTNKSERKEDIESLRVELKNRDEIFEDRITKLEKWKYYILGFAGAIALVVDLLLKGSKL